MSLLARLGRPDEKNNQVMIFASKSEEAPDDSYRQLKLHIHQKIVEEMSPDEHRILSAVQQNPVQVEAIINNYLQRIVDEDDYSVAMRDRPRLVSDIRDEMLGLGPLEALRKDDTITEIMVNGPKQIFVERMGHPVSYTHLTLPTKA